MESFEGNKGNWSEIVEDLVQDGDTEKAISFLETVVSKLEKDVTGGNGFSELVTALLELSKLYSTLGFFLKAEETRSRAFQINQKFQEQGVRSKRDLNVVKESSSDALPRVCDSNNDVSTSDQDDWEAVADRAPDELLSPTSLQGISELTLEDNQVKGPKRRGRGTFSYRKHGLYSDEKSDEALADDEEQKADCPSSDGGVKTNDLMYGTRHVLVLADFPPSTRTTDLEKFLEGFKDSGVAIRWVNETVALAVFRSPSVGNYSTCFCHELSNWLSNFAACWNLRTTRTGLKLLLPDTISGLHFH